MTITGIPAPFSRPWNPQPEQAVATLPCPFAKMPARLRAHLMDDDPYPPAPRRLPFLSACRHRQHPPSLPPTGGDARVCNDPDCLRACSAERLLRHVRDVGHDLAQEPPEADGCHLQARG